MTAINGARKKQFLLSVLFYAVIVALIWVVVTYFLGWVMPFIIGYLIAAIVQPAVYLLHKRMRLNRRAAGILTVLLFLAAFGLLMAFCISKIIAELAAVVGMLPGLIDSCSNGISHLSGNISGYLSRLPAGYSERLAAYLTNASNELLRLSSLSSGAASFAMQVASKVPGLLVGTIVTIVAACFFSMDYGQIRGFCLRQLPERHRLIACDIKNFFFKTIARLIRAYLTLMLITFCELSIGLALIRVPHAIAVAALIAVVDILPVLGTGTIMIPWAVVELLIGRFTLALCLGILYAVVTVVRNILEPKIVGYHIGLYPLATLMSIYIGLMAFGPAGMFLFPIAIILLKHLQDTGKIRLWKD